MRRVIARSGTCVGPFGHDMPGHGGVCIGRSRGGIIPRHLDARGLARCRPPFCRSTLNLIFREDVRFGRGARGETPPWLDQIQLRLHKHSGRTRSSGPECIIITHPHLARHLTLRSRVHLGIYRRGARGHDTFRLGNDSCGLDTHGIVALSLRTHCLGGIGDLRREMLCGALGCMPVCSTATS
jgi:hypothetical protein